MSNQANGLYEFEPYRLDQAKRLLTRSGESIALAPKTFDLLLLLVGGQGRVLTKTELMTALWPDTFVDEASLSSPDRHAAQSAGFRGRGLDRDRSQARLPVCGGDRNHPSG